MRVGSTGVESREIKLVNLIEGYWELLYSLEDV